MMAFHDNLFTPTLIVCLMALSAIMLTSAEGQDDPTTIIQPSAGTVTQNTVKPSGVIGAVSTDANTGGSKDTPDKVKYSAGSSTNSTAKPSGLTGAVTTHPGTGIPGRDHNGGSKDTPDKVKSSAGSSTNGTAKPSGLTGAVTTHPGTGIPGRDHNGGSNDTHEKVKSSAGTSTNDAAKPSGLTGAVTTHPGGSKDTPDKVKSSAGYSTNGTAKPSGLTGAVTTHSGTGIPGRDPNGGSNDTPDKVKSSAGTSTNGTAKPSGLTDAVTTHPGTGIRAGDATDNNISDNPDEGNGGGVSNGRQNDVLFSLSTAKTSGIAGANATTADMGNERTLTDTNTGNTVGVDSAEDQPNAQDSSQLSETSNGGPGKTEYQSKDEAPSSGHFFAYFLTAVVICISGYVIFHNKQKILAFILEGRDSTGGRRRRSKNGVQYSKLQSNVEEVIPSLDKATYQTAR